MKTTRNELIDLFTKYKVRSNYKPMYEIADMIIDRFKSINSASNETENEAKKEFTQRLLNKMEDLDPEYVSLVNNEFWNLFE